MPEVLTHNGDKVSFGDVFNNQLAMDAVNPLGGGVLLNNFYVSALNSILIDDIYLGDGENALLSQNGLINRVLTVLAEEMCRAKIEIISTHPDKEAGMGKISKLEKEFGRLGVQEMRFRSLFIAFNQGATLIYPKLKNDELDNERLVPLVIEDLKISKGDLEYIQNIEPVWYYPIQFNTIDPFSKWFYEPELYTVMGTTIHSTRITKMIYGELPNMLKPMYKFNGMPLTELLVPYVLKFQQTYNEIAAIIRRYNLTVLKTDLEALIGSDPDSAMKAASSLAIRLSMFNQLRDNKGVLGISGDEEVQQLQMSLTALDKLLSQFIELAAVTSGVPATKLYGTSPQGMNATGEFEMRNFYDRCSSLSERMERPWITQVLKLAQLNIFGKIDENITFQFGKLEESNKVEDSQIQLNNSNAMVALVGAGIITDHAARIRLANDPLSGWDELDVEEEDLSNAENTEVSPQNNPDEFE